MRPMKSSIERVVIKVGTSSLTHENGKINLKYLDQLCWEIAHLMDLGYQVILVSSAAIAVGAFGMGMKERPREVIAKQAASAVGQVALMNLYTQGFSHHGYMPAQILLTKIIEGNEEMTLNAQNTFERLLAQQLIPIVNENDAISTYEIEYGDNDTLSAMVARLVGADLLILLTDTDGLYSDNPRKNPEAERISYVPAITAEVEAVAQGAGSALGTGGMATKIKAAKLAGEKGIDTIIANGRDIGLLEEMIGGEDIGTFFKG
ncbi:MAG: glutamate 5-kinase [Tissierellia bacterium]|nr:glutamate 5-kinase [Tissierellia bacterium]